MKIGRITLSDRASKGQYEDLSGPEIDKRITTAFQAHHPQLVTQLLPDDFDQIQSALKQMTDVECCDLVLTTGGTGPSRRDITPEATCSVLEKELPGFGEIMRVQSFTQVPTAILSRATAGVRGQSLIINLPGNPKAIGECLPLLLPAIEECLKHLHE